MSYLFFGMWHVVLSMVSFSRIPETSLSLRSQLAGDILEEDGLLETLLRTQTRLQVYMTAYPASVGLPLIGADDPYTSVPSDSHGAYFGVTHWPVFAPSRLTYGSVYNVLTGTIHVLCQGKNSISALFLVSHDLYVNLSNTVHLIEWDTATGLIPMFKIHFSAFSSRADH